MAGCEGCENGYGLIVIYDVLSGELTEFVIKGDPGSGKKVGSSVIIQRDTLSSGNRIWYATENSIIASSLITYVNEKKFEDEIFIQT